MRNWRHQAKGGVNRTGSKPFRTRPAQSSQFRRWFNHRLLIRRGGEAETPPFDLGIAYATVVSSPKYATRSIVDRIRFSIYVMHRPSQNCISPSPRAALIDLTDYADVSACKSGVVIND
jgi:hypothetical protein